MVILPAVTPWTMDCRGTKLYGLGDRGWLATSPIAFFASRKCPGSAIRAATEWALAQARARQVLIGGFHSPLEQSVLQLLLQARSPVVVVLARSVVGAQLKTDWKTAITEGRMAVVSACTDTVRLTNERAAQRNELAAQLAESVVIAHANPGGGLARQSGSWERQGMRVINLHS